MRKFLYLTLFFSFFKANTFAVSVPDTLTFCEMELTFTKDAKYEIQKTINKLTESPYYFDILLKRTKLFIPFVEEAFEIMNVPDDLKFLAIQESAMKGNAVSSSNAVGFWQFKKSTAELVGLQVNNYVDERKHIFRSSIGAARYFRLNYYFFRNWVYAITAYYTGTTGAFAHVNGNLVGKNKMKIDSKVHWYVKKAIAHKIVFDKYLQKKNMPQKWLQPYIAQNGESINTLAKKHHVSVQEFKTYNFWAQQYKIPNGYAISYYIPSKGEYVCHPKDPLCYLFEKKQQKKKQEDKIIPLDSLKKFKSDTMLIKNYPIVAVERQAMDVVNYFDDEIFELVRFEIASDAKEEYIFVKKGEKLNDISKKLNIKLENLKLWNKLYGINVVFKNDAFLRRRSYKTAKIHIVHEDENLEEIAKFYALNLKKLKKNNRIKENKIYLGQKLLLRDKLDKYEEVELIYPENKYYLALHDLIENKKIKK